MIPNKSLRDIADIENRCLRHPRKFADGEHVTQVDIITEWPKTPRHKKRVLATRCSARQLTGDAALAAVCPAPQFAPRHRRH